MFYNTRSASKMSISEDLKEYFSNLIKPLATSNEALKNMLEKMQKDINDKFESLIKEQNDKINELESSIKVKDVVIPNLVIQCDDNSQYSRRSSLRVHGVPVKDSIDGNENILTTLQECYKSVNATFKSEEIDRAHRIGPVYHDKDGNKVRSIIVKYKSWKAREEFYLKRPKFSKNKPVSKSFSVSVDLTKRRYELLSKAKRVVTGNRNVNYVFSNINCALGISMKDGSFKYFNTDAELDDILN